MHLPPSRVVVHALYVGQNMKRFIILVVIAILTLIGIGYVATWNDIYSEVNTMTGAIRTKKKYANFIESDWKVRDTWISDSATRQDIQTESGWQYLSGVSNRLFFTYRGSGRSPVSYQVNAINPEYLELDSTESIDQFVREFVATDEEGRRQMLLEP
jgi:hypothetical protein